MGLYLGIYCPLDVASLSFILLHRTLYCFSTLSTSHFRFFLHFNELACGKNVWHFPPLISLRSIITWHHPWKNFEIFRKISLPFAGSTLFSQRILVKAKIFTLKHEYLSKSDRVLWNIVNLREEKKGRFSKGMKFHCA